MLGYSARKPASSSAASVSSVVARMTSASSWAQAGRMDTSSASSSDRRVTWVLPDVRFAADAFIRKMLACKLGAKAEPLGGGGMRVLVVEDDPALARGLVATLK